MATDTVLQARGLVKEFSGFRAIDGVDLAVKSSTVHALVGPNGASKTTLFTLLTGFLKPTQGSISIFNEDVTRLSPDRIARRGIARSFQITSLFEQLTVLEHVQLALQSATTLGYHFWAPDRALHRFRPKAMEHLARVGLADMSARPASSLPYGQKRALEMALALAIEPRLLLLDEPTAGMALMTILGGSGTLWGSVVGAAVVLLLQDFPVVHRQAHRRHGRGHRRAVHGHRAGREKGHLGRRRAVAHA
jgi:branched-chain amino acid transport system ATP-binding protein